MKYPILLPSRKEISWGWRYLAFEIAFLSYFLSIAVRFLNLPWGNAELNLAFFCLNFIAVMVIFRHFLVSTAKLIPQRIDAILITAAVGFFVYQILSTMVSVGIVMIKPDFYNVNNANLSSISRKYYWLTTVAIVILAPITEELLHRGAIFGGLYRKSRIAAYAVSTVVFALVHITGYIGYAAPKTLLLCFMQYIPAGLCLAAAYDISGSIATPILIHTAINVAGAMAMR